MLSWRYKQKYTQTAHTKNVQKTRLKLLRSMNWACPYTLRTLGQIKFFTSHACQCTNKQRLVMTMLLMDRTKKEILSVMI